MRVATFVGFLGAIALCFGLGAAFHATPEREAIVRPDDPDRAAEYFVARRVADGEELSPARYDGAIARRASMPQTNATRAKIGAPVWRAIGPTGVGGRTRAIVIDPAQPDVVYAGGVSGGVWKSTDGAQTWRPSGQIAFLNLAVVTLAMDPADRDTLYAGTGEGVYVGRPVRRSRGVRGNGVFVTRDAGATWRSLDSTRDNANFDYVNRLAFDAAGRLHAATRTGLWVTSNGGASWTRGLQPPNAEGCAEIVHVPPSRMLASCGVFSPSSIYASDDGGATWRQTALGPTSGRTTLAVSKSDARVVYAATAHRADYSLLALRRSDDGGATWRVVADVTSTDPFVPELFSHVGSGLLDGDTCLFGGSGGGQGWYDNALAVDPVNPDVVLVGGVDLFRSDDGGRTFRQLSRWDQPESQPDFVHADQHTIVFDPRYDGTTNRRVLIGNDGGVFVTDDALTRATANPCGANDTPVWVARNSGYQATQFYDGAVSADGVRVIGGTQDNGTRLGTTLTQPWTEVSGGDGGYAFFDPRNSARFYFATQFGRFRRTDDDGATSQSLLIDTGLPFQSSNYLFIAPLILDPNDPDALWTGAGRTVYRSVNRGDNWTATSAPITTGTTLVSAIGVARGDSTRVTVAFDNGLVAASRNGGANWTTRQPREGFPSSLTYDPVEPDRVYLTYATFGGAHVLMSTDAGTTFAPIDGGGAFALPDVPVLTLAIDPRDRNRLWIGTDIGVFTSPDRGASWYADASGLGNAVVEQLVVAGSGDAAELVAFTYGNGIYRARLADLGTPALNPGYTGAWYDANVPGQGMMLEVLPNVRELAVGWYTYGVDGGHAWLVGNGPLSGTRATIPLFSVPSGRFAATGAAPVEASGDLTIDFTDCTRATATYSIRVNGAQRSGTIALTRLTSAAYCDAFRAHGDGALSELSSGGAPGDLEYGHGGLWADPSAASQGFVIDVDARSRTAFGGWYTYDPLAPQGAGQAPVWYSVQGTLSGRVAELQVFRTSGGRFALPTSVTTQPIGTLRITARDCLKLDAEYSIALTDASTRQGTFALDRIAAPAVCDAMAP